MLKDSRSHLTTSLDFMGFEVLTAGSKQSFASCFLQVGFLLGLFDPEDGGGMFFINVRSILNGLYGIIS
jgi:hypothetical protein